MKQGGGSVFRDASLEQAPERFLKVAEQFGRRSANQYDNET